ncbi:MAG: ribosome biogenesis GTPase YlqF [Oscillospiraceae bacterium]|jgi:ribosome biogenesis GTPase A|nr:ribosome biogenesis GTPase YlqF [Oscillospiraceae bacterium]
MFCITHKGSENNIKNTDKESFCATPINWFPGHMAKTVRKLKEDLNLVDIVAEVIDARIPISSKNPEIDFIISKKPRFIILNKADLADNFQTSAWQKYYNSINIPSIKLNCIKDKAMPEFCKICQSILKDKIEKWHSKGMIGKNIKVMIVGVPNVGKSTLINNLTKKKRAEVENKPGITRINQWFSINNGFELLDTPGVLWPKFESQIVSQNLAFTGAIKDAILDYEDIAFHLVKKLIKKYPDNLTGRFDINLLNSQEPDTIIENIGKKRGILTRGGSVNTEKISRIIVNEFKTGKLGKITLESVDDVIENYR